MIILINGSVYVGKCPAYVLTRFWLLWDNILTTVSVEEYTFSLIMCDLVTRLCVVCKRSLAEEEFYLQCSSWANWEEDCDSARDHLNIVLLIRSISLSVLWTQIAFSFSNYRLNFKQVDVVWVIEKTWECMKSIFLSLKENLDPNKTTGPSLHNSKAASFVKAFYI